MDIGRMRTRATVMQYQEGGGRDPVTGYPLPAGWIEVGAIWGNLLLTSGKEIVSADAKWAINEGSFRTRFGAEVSPTDRLRIDGQEYEIAGVLPDINDRKYCDIILKKGLV